ncbi:Hpt domain-containing protein [Arthrobacter sp. C152]
MPPPYSEPPADPDSQVPHLPLLDLAVLRELEDQLEGPLVQGFARDYIGMWDYRCERLVRALACHEGNAEALDAAISLRVTSRMLGGLRLAGLTAALEKQITDGSLRGAGALLGEIRRCGQVTVEQLRLRYCAQA